MLEKVPPVESVHEWWRERSTTIMSVGQDVLGMTTCRNPRRKDTLWWWNYNVKKVIKAK